MALLIGFLTVFLVLDCLLLMLLVLIQLPKKEAGMGMAFGGAATETLFGAGSGNVLTKVTKYAAGMFMGLSLLLAILGSHEARKNARGLSDELQKRAGEMPIVAPQPAAPGEALAPTSSPTFTLTSPTNAPTTSTNPAPTP